jgi:DNA helicase II / ATP-dependent DNA helicase PcrA
MAATRRSISCVYCGGAHASAAEVRECWQRNDQGQEPLPLDSFAPESFAPESFSPESFSPESGSGDESYTVRSATRIGRGPTSLGRNVLVATGQATPPAWSDARRVVVSTDPDLIIELQALAHRREGVVLEVSADLAPESLVLGRATEPPHVLGPRFTFALDTLRHLLVSNSVDARDGWAWPLLQHARALGANQSVDDVGDIVLRDGARAWLDGGPVRFTPPIDGVPVIHRVAVEHESLRVPVSNESTADLAPDQLAAVTHPEGAARIIAPAGSGKTRVLTERARHLLRQWQLPTTAVCLVAFNKRAQEEMVERTPDLRGLQVRTLNAIALAIVNGTSPFHQQSRRMATIDEPEVRRLIGSLVAFPRKRNADPVATWLEALSLARLGLRDPVEVEQVYDGDVDGFAAVFSRFRHELARTNTVDYDEQIYRAIELLLTDPAARAAAQRACRVLLVDEFQDLTPAHLLLVRLLAGPDGAVFGVGDDDQTIYGYNGADPGWLIDFASLFPGAGEHPLEVNYRCPGGIVRAADTLLRHNRRRVSKTIRAQHRELEGFMVAPADGDSVDTTVQGVTTAIAAGSSPSEIAVLTRVNSLLVPVQVALHMAGVPTTGGVGREFAERTAVRAALAWLRLATASGTLSESDVGEALRRPSRSMHPRVAGWAAEQTTVAGLRRLADRITTERDAKSVLEFAADIEVLQHRAATRGTTSELLAAVRDQMGLATSIATLDLHRKGMNRAAQNDDLTALAQLAGLQPDPALFESWLRRALDATWQQGGVTLATVHRVKGLEWPFVVVHHADADQFPHRLATDTEEERRLFHVAITRASRDVLVVPSDRPSPFILDCSTEPSARRPDPVAPSPAPKRSAPITKPGEALTGDAQQRFQALREWRRHAAVGKPAYTVFADATLDAIAQANPSSLDELARLKGVGPAKLEQYGDGVLRTLADLG